jgi:6-pyruvoyltetrahydropterin/6-carboxytetrahydropterin synthase
MEVYVSGEVDPETGYLFDLKLLKDIIKEEVEDRYDHKNLNLDVDDYKDIQPSTENIAFKIHELLSKRIDDKYKIRVHLWETERNGVVYPALD